MRKLLLLLSLCISAQLPAKDVFKRIYDVPSAKITCLAGTPVNNSLAVGTDMGLMIRTISKNYIINTDSSWFTAKVINDVMWFNSSLWVATDSGLFELSSADYSLKNHYDKGNSNIPTNYITCLSYIYFMGEPTVLGGTLGQGLAIFDLTNGWWENAIGVGYDENTINDIVTIFGQVLIMATNAGMNIGDEVWGPFSVYNKSNSDIGADKINSITKEGNSDLWLCHNDGVTWYDGFDVKIYDSLTADLPTNKIQSAAYLDGDHMCFGAVNGDFILFNVNDEKATKYYNSINSNLPECIIYDLVTDYIGNVWIATDKGLYLYAEGGFVGVDDIKQNATFTIYPNPSNGIFTITFIGDSKRVINVIDTNGKLVFSNSSTNSNYTLNLSNFTSGVYYLQVIGEGKTSTKKLLVY